MAVIQWNDSLSVRVAELDLQHQRLVGMINDLGDAMRQGKGNAVLDAIVNSLIDYAVLHFATEEKYFDRFGYPEAAGHKKEHADFAAQVLQFKAGLAAGHLGMTVRIMTFLSDWLQHHIKGSDRKYGPFFNDRGLK